MFEGFFKEKIGNVASSEGVEEIPIDDVSTEAADKRDAQVLNELDPQELEKIADEVEKEEAPVCEDGDEGMGTEDDDLKMAA